MSKITYPTHDSIMKLLTKILLFKHFALGGLHNAVWAKIFESKNKSKTYGLYTVIGDGPH